MTSTLTHPSGQLPSPALLIGEERVSDSSGGTFTHVYPATGEAPFGGNKQSGIRRIGGKAGRHEFLRPKNVYISFGP